MTSRVRLSPSRSIASLTAAAFSGSRLAVGSSRMTNDALRRNALARAMRCRSPAETGRPPSPTIVPYPSGSARMKSSAPARRQPRRLGRRPPRGLPAGCCRPPTPEERRAAAAPRRASDARQTDSRARARRRPRSRALPSARRARGGVTRWCSCRCRSSPRAPPSRPDAARDRRRRERWQRGTGMHTRRPRGGSSRRARAAESPRSPVVAIAGCSVSSSRRSATASPSALAWYWAPRLRSGR